MAYPTNPIYKLAKGKDGNTACILKTTTSSSELCIPLDEANTDYQAYLKWKADGGVPDAAD